ncbi:MAG TPA: hypothetical protein VN154_08650 [Rhizomicrobium sp.]|nr:hypothetical protein [Rhizomicrobium sp.]
MRSSRYLLLVAATFLGLIALSVVDAWLQIDTPTRNGAYSCAYIAGKVAAGTGITAPKIVISSGSNALMGIDAKVLTHALNVRVFNFGLAASFGPGFQTFEAHKILRPGDAALLPLEYLAYDYTTPRDALVDAVYTCGFDYWHTLDLRQKAFFVLAAKPQRLVDSILFRRRPGLEQRTVANAWHDVGPYGEGPETGAHKVDTRGIPVGTHWPLAIHLDEQSPGARAIASFVAWAKANRVSVFATWPTTLYFDQYRTDPVFDSIRRFYEKLGVPVINTPEEAMFPQSQMADTIYHLNPTGKALRTERLLRGLRADPAFVAWWLTAKERAGKFDVSNNSLHPLAEVSASSSLKTKAPLNR